MWRHIRSGTYGGEGAACHLWLYQTPIHIRDMERTAGGWFAGSASKSGYARINRQIKEEVKLPPLDHTSPLPLSSELTWRDAVFPTCTHSWSVKRQMWKYRIQTKQLKLKVALRTLETSLKHYASCLDYEPMWCKFDPASCRWWLFSASDTITARVFLSTPNPALLASVPHLNSKSAQGGIGATSSQHSFEEIIYVSHRHHP